MPTIIIYPLDNEIAVALPRHVGRALHGAFFHWLTLGDAALAASSHAGDNEARPFTVALIREAEAVPATLRFTLLDDALLPALLQAMQRQPVVSLAGCDIPLDLERLHVKTTTYEALAAHARDTTQIALRFVSPTSFRSRGMHVPLPEPFLVFQSWLLRWNAFAPESLQFNIALLDIVLAHVAIEAHQMRTRVVAYDETGRVIGFVGKVRLRVLHSHKLEPEWLRALNTLADYAEYCSTGHKTTHGLGQTRRLA